MKKRIIFILFILALIFSCKAQNDEAANFDKLFAEIDVIFENYINTNKVTGRSAVFDASLSKIRSYDKSTFCARKKYL